MWCSREMIINMKSKLDIKQHKACLDSMRIECIIMLSFAQKPVITTCSCLCRGFVPYSQLEEHCLVLRFSPWHWAHCCPPYDLGWRLLWFPWPAVSCFSSQAIRGVGMGERGHCVPEAQPLPRWVSARVLPWCQEFRLIFGLEWTLQLISGCSQPQHFILWQLSFF